MRQGVTLDVIGESTSVAPRDGLPEANGDVERLHRLLAGAWAEGHLHERHFGGLLPAASSGGGRLQPRARRRSTQLERMKTARCALDGGGRLGARDARFESGGPEQPDEVIEVAKVVAQVRRHLRVAHRQRRRRAGRELDFAIRVAEEAEDAGPHLSPEDPRRGKLGHDRKISREDRGGARARPRHHRQPVSVHGDAARLERVLPGVGARGRAAEVCRRC